MLYITLKKTSSKRTQTPSYKACIQVGDTRNNGCLLARTADHSQSRLLTRVLSCLDSITIEWTTARTTSLTASHLQVGQPHPRRLQALLCISCRPFYPNMTALWLTNGSDCDLLCVPANSHYYECHLLVCKPCNSASGCVCCWFSSELCRA